jgi:hypothetical protein
VIARVASSVILAGALLLGTTGCTFFAEQATRIEYNPSDGVIVKLGDVRVLNAIALSADGRDVSLLFTASNSSTEDKTLRVQVDVNGEKVDRSIRVPAQGTTSIGSNGDSTLIFSDVNVQLGSVMPVYFQWGTTQGEQAIVPILDGSTGVYGDLLPPVRAED